MALDIDRRTEIFVDGQWTDITSDARETAPVVIERGARTESATAGPSRMTLTLNNRHGRYSPDNPMSPNYGKIGRNTPIRFSVRQDERYLPLVGTSGAYASTPDTAALDIVGDIDVRVEATVDWYATRGQTLIGKWGEPNQRSWCLSIKGGILYWDWTVNGTTSIYYGYTLPALPRRAALRVTLDVNNGSGGLTWTAYWAPSLDGPWTAFITAPTTTGTTSIYNSTAPLRLGPPTSFRDPARGQVHRAEVRSGIGGTVVAAPTVRALAPGATSWTDTAGRPWTLTGTAISDRSYRFTGEVTAWPQEWDTSGSDRWVPIDAAGVLRRLGQGRRALSSTLRRSIPRDPNLLAYWPMEDGEYATSAASPVAGVRPLQVTGAKWASVTSLLSSAPLPALASSSGTLAQITGAVPPPTGTPTGWRVEWVYKLDTPPVTLYTFMRINAAGGTIVEWLIQSNATGSRIVGRDATGADVVTNNIGTGLDLFAQWNSVSFSVEQIGTTVQYDIVWTDVGGRGGHYGNSITGTVGRVRNVGGPGNGYAAALDGMSVGHVAVFSTPLSTAFAGAVTGWDKEPALDRLRRLSDEESRLLSLSWTDADRTRTSTLMGPQRPAELLALLRECEASDGGMLTEHRDRLALHYRDRVSLYNQTPVLVLSYPSGDLAPGLRPAPDDQRIRNDVTVTRRGGSSGRVEVTSGPLSTQPPESGGVGVYEDSVELSLGLDEQTDHIAGWLAHLGTVAEPRYPAVRIALHRSPGLIPAALALDLCDVLQINDLPDGLPPDPALGLVRGIKEEYGAFTWDATYSCTPARPWTVGVYDDPLRGRYDTGGSQLAAGATATATTLSVAYTDGTRWATSSGHPSSFPFEVAIGGERMRVTAITGTTSPQAWTVVRSVNGVRKAQTAGTDVRLADPTVYSL
ncbi:hypothetical protein [Streptomyces sp. NPDC060198]|uniref:hypothetical protein n=1 Tax=Streptomyces sp. NPDC060198 TaxID=3347070 RepID=UPI003656F1BA